MPCIAHIPRVNLPNAITLSRLVLCAIFVIAMELDGTAASLVALLTFSVAAATDWLDGYLARKLGLVTPLGKLLDPLADKILVCAAFVFLSVEGIAPVWVTAVIIAREFLVTGLRQIAVEAGQVLAADRLGKWKTTFQLVFVIAALLHLFCGQLDEPGSLAQTFYGLTAPDGWLVQVSLWGALGLTLVSGWNYLWSSRQLLVRH